MPGIPYAWYPLCLVSYGAAHGRGHAMQTGARRCANLQGLLLGQHVGASPPTAGVAPVSHGRAQSPDSNHAWRLHAQ